MKKNLSILLMAIFVVLVAPLTVNAAVKASFVKTENNCKTTNGKCSSTTEIYISGTEEEIAAIGYETEALVNVLNVSFTPSEGNEIKSFVANTELFTQTESTSGYTLTSKTKLSGTKILVGTVTTEYSSDKGCSLDVKIEGVSLNIKEGESPATGAALPYTILVGAAVIAIGAYLVSRKQTKMFKI